MRFDLSIFGRWRLSEVIMEHGNMFKMKGRYSRTVLRIITLLSI